MVQRAAGWRARLGHNVNGEMETRRRGVEVVFVVMGALGLYFLRCPESSLLWGNNDFKHPSWRAIRHKCFTLDKIRSKRSKSNLQSDVMSGQVTQIPPEAPRQQRTRYLLPGLQLNTRSRDRRPAGEMLHMWKFFALLISQLWQISISKQRLDLTPTSEWP